MNNVEELTNRENKKKKTVTIIEAEINLNKI